MRVGLLLSGLLPLASLWGAPAVTLALSSGSVPPGGAVALQVVLVTAESAQPSAVQWTINYSSPSISAVAVQAGSAASAAGKTVECSGELNPGMRRCVVFGLNQSAMTAGPIAVLTFHLEAGAPAGTIPVGISGVEAADPGGVPIEIRPAPAGGTITVSPPGAQLEVFPPQVDFFLPSGAPPLSQALYVTAANGQALPVNVSASSGGWLTASPSMVTTPGRVVVGIAGAAPGRASGAVSLAPLSQSVPSVEVPVNVQSAGATMYFIPRVADGGGFATTLTISNLDTAPALVSLRFRRSLPDLTTVPWTPLMEGGQTTENVVIPVGGSFTWRTSGLGGQADAGWAQAISDRAIGGFAVYRQRVGGRADQEAAVPMISSWQQRILVPFDNTGGLVTSLAITNTSAAETGQVRAIFRAENGQPIQGAYSIVLPPQGHAAFAAPSELPVLQNRRGTAEFVMTGGRMAAVGLRFSASAFTCFEAQSLNSASSGRLVLPQVANAGGFFTTITLVNRDAVPAAVSLRFYRRTGSDGSTQAWEPPMVNSQPTQGVTIPAGSSVTWQTTGTGDAEQGWAEVVTNQQVSGFAVFLQRLAGRFDQEAAAPVNAGPQMRFLLPFDNTQPFTTTMALASFDGRSTLAATVRDEQHRILEDQVIALPERGHLAFETPRRFPQSAGRRGTIEFHVQYGSISALGLRFAGEAFTSFKPQVIQ